MRALVEDMLRYRRQFEAVRDLTRQSDAGEISGVEPYPYPYPYPHPYPYPQP